MNDSTQRTEKDAPVCICPLRNVGHTHACLAERLARLERVVDAITSPEGSGA